MLNILLIMSQFLLECHSKNKTKQKPESLFSVYKYCLPTPPPLPTSLTIEDSMFTVCFCVTFVGMPNTA